MIKHKFVPKLLLIILSGLVISLPKLAYAQSFFENLIGSIFSLGGIAATAILVPMTAMGYLVAVATGLLLTLVSALGSLMMALQNLILSEQNVIVQIGWSVVRDIANLGFVLAIVVIAVATILRFEEYGVKKLLPKLIAAAILVNFSLTIGAVVINFTNVLMDFFSQKAGAGEIVSLLAGSLNPQRFFQNVSLQSFTSALTGFTQAAIMFTISPWFIAIFNIVAAFVFSVFGFMLLARFLWLSFLLIISPIIWLFWVIPALAGQFQKWWNKFFQWTFFAPIVMFFMYLALVSAEALKNLGAPEIVGRNIFANFGDLITNIFTQGLQMVLIIGVVIGGLLMAQSMSITGAKGAMQIAKKTSTGIRKGVGSYLTETAPGKLSQFGTTFRGKPTGTLIRGITWPTRKIGEGLQAIQKGAGGLRERLGLTPAQLKKPNTLLGHIYKSVRGELKKKKRKLTPTEIAAGEAEIPEAGGEEEIGGTSI